LTINGNATMGDHRVSVRDEASNTNGGGRKMPESNSVYGDGRRPDK
jgi:hypothetical protein